MLCWFVVQKEVIQALPKLIKLNPVVVKEVFNRLLGTQHSEGSSSMSPLTPGELLVALHNVDSTKCDMKSIIKATNLCFGERNVFTSEVLAVVMQQLMEHSPLPILLMRTVIQSLTMYPRLGGFVMNILSRLIVKQVWKYPKVWEGFVKCCQRTRPQSYSVLLQLPPAQLTSVFERCPEMREPLLQHVLSFTPHQQAHITASVMTVLEANSKQPELEAMRPVLLERKVETLPAAIAASVTSTPAAMKVPIANAPVLAEPPLVPLKEQELHVLQVVATTKDEEEPMDEGGTTPCGQEVNTETVLQVDLPVLEENSTQDSEEKMEEPVEERMEETEPTDVVDQLKDVIKDSTSEPESARTTEKETGTGDAE
ncbi:hypothetical protein DPEC_G00239720 [Dallia pectoralis]|uniref:Uncharacterized protein n=1 Tax=Dallia pectoralis TaxID=75939 RepID=A0ACC2FZ06_DALPE|nr:hypothetical protein DPEC_G00239720 [Dallia pectoralis]